MLTMDDIIRDGHPALRKIAVDVPLPASDEDKNILASMIEYVKNSQNPEIAEEYNLRPGIGIAAPQINVSKRMIAVHLEDDQGNLFSYALFNPRIVSHSVEKSYLTTGEGCLSVDYSVPGYVPRYARITVSATDIVGNPVNLRLKGLPAIAFQHEIDHLNGVMFYDHIDKNDPFKPIENAVPVGR